MSDNRWTSPRALAIAIMAAVLLADQLLKLWVKTHMAIGEEIHVAGNWFILHFTENPGMAFGMKFWGSGGKIALSIFRLLAIGAIGYYLHLIISRGAKHGIVLGIALIMAGAMGNMIDSSLYGLIFDSGTTYNADGGYWAAYPGVSQLGGGYTGFLQGCVVDMFYFPVIDTTLPSWVPFWGGEPFVFFRPVFNIADAAISCGVIYLLLFQRKALMATDGPQLDAAA